MSNSTTANILAASASSRAQESKEIACKAFMPDYQHSTATQQEARIYAECVKVVYPAPITGAETLALKGLVLACLVTGAFCAWRERYDSPGAIAWVFCLGVIMCAVVCLGLLALISAVAFLFTA